MCCFFHSILVHCISFHCILIHSIVFHSVLLRSVLLHSILVRVFFFFFPTGLFHGAPFSRANGAGGAGAGLRGAREL